MARTDWSLLTEGLDTNDVRMGVTAGTSKPNGGGTHCYGMRLVEDAPGAAGLYLNVTNFAPVTDKGGRITGALRRASATASTGFSPFLFFSAAGTRIESNAYMLGLSDEESSHIQLRKGSMLLGLPAPAVVDPDAAPNILMRSTDTFPADSWQHLRLDVIVQGSGDVILQVFRNDLALHDVTSPVWLPVPGMEGPFAPSFQGFVDDGLGVNTGTTPLIGGYCGFATRFETANRAAYFDHVAVDRQL